MIMSINPLPTKIITNSVPINSSHLSFIPIRIKTNNFQSNKRIWAVRSDNNNPTAVVDSATEVVKRFYEKINGRDLVSVEELIGENCVYEDLVFAKPFMGRKAIIEFFQKFIDSISTDLQFAIDDISGEDTSAIGVTWHLEWKGKPFPFSKGCSFYRLDMVNGKRQIMFPTTVIGEFSHGIFIHINIDVKGAMFGARICENYGRDCVEPATKPGEIALERVLIGPKYNQLTDIYYSYYPRSYLDAAKISTVSRPAMNIKPVAALLRCPCNEKSI